MAPARNTSLAAFRPDRSLIGMIHVGALPGTPRGETPVDLLAAQASVEARQLADAGFDALIVENMHDAPYVHGEALGPEIVAAMTRIALEVEACVALPFGVQILSGGNRHAIAVALAAGGAFIRAENFVFAHVADEGLLAEAEAGELLRYRKKIAAGDIKVFADIKKKHASHAITADITLEEAAEAALFFGADGLVVTGAATGKPTNPDHVRRVKHVAGDTPVLVGSGVTTETAAGLLDHADALIVGSAIKHDGRWSNAVDPERAAAIVKSARG